MWALYKEVGQRIMAFGFSLFALILPNMFYGHVILKYSQPLVREIPNSSSFSIRSASDKVVLAASTTHIGNVETHAFILARLNNLLTRKVRHMSTCTMQCGCFAD